MARPASGTTVGRADLGAVAYEYFTDATRQGFIGSRLLPVFEVPEKTGQYPKIPTEALLKVPDTKRAPRGAYNRAPWEFEMGTYDCEEYGWEEPLDDGEAAMYARLFDAEEVNVARATSILLRGYEQRVASLLFNTSNFSNSGITNEWDDAANATPKADVKTAIAAMRAASGLTPNVVVMSKTVFDNVMVTSEIKSYLQYTSPHLVLGEEAQRRMLAAYFGVDEILVGGGMYDSAKKGQAMSLANVWSNEYVGFFRVASPDAMDLREPVVGRSFLWTGDTPQMLTVDEPYREEQIRSWVYRVRANVDEALVFTGAGYLLSNATT